MQQTIIADISDIDRCLTIGNSQDPWLRSLGINPKDFWDYSDDLVFKEGYDFELGYLQAILDWIKDGRLPQLSNSNLFEAGKIAELAPGLPDFFKWQKEEIEEDPKYRAYGISIEFYANSTGIEPMIEGAFPGIFNGIYAARFAEENGVIAKIKRAVCYTKKTQYLHKLNKGCNVDSNIDVNARMHLKDRRIPYPQLVYRGDGITDVACLAEVDDRDGFVEVVYEDTQKAFDGAQRLIRDRRARVAFPADYRKGSDLYNHSIAQKRMIADNIVRRLG